jgi:rod shape determining protein RodA
MVQWSITGPSRFPEGHVIRLAAASIAAIFAAAYGARRWQDSAWFFYGTSLALLVLVLLVGRATNNANRWLDLAGGFKLQPSELMKLGLMLALARWFSEKRNAPAKMGDLFVPGLMTAIPAGLVLLQPDLGTALTFGPVFLGMSWVAGAPWKLLKWFLLVPLAIFPFALFAVHDYQLERIDIWWNQDSLTQEQKNDAGYHLWHSKLAIGSGGMNGAGWAQGPENRLDRLPERHNDFIFPVIAEEWGFVGATTFLGLYALLVLSAFSAARRYRDPFTRFVVAGVGMHFAVHLCLNVGVTLGVFPTTGLPLPMVSFGGTSMLVSGLAIGLALAVGASKAPVFSNRAFEE